MKNLGKLKLNQLGKAELEKREMNFLRGGDMCNCGCYYEGTPGGSSLNANGNANAGSGKDSCECSCPEETYASTGRSNQV